MPSEHRRAFLFICLLIGAIANGGIRAPGKYTGVVIFDRWDSCYLYSGVYLMEVSERVKESLRPYRDQAIIIDAKEVLQPVNPGDGLITKLKVLGPAKDQTEETPFGLPVLGGLSLKVTSNLPNGQPNELLIELRNDGTKRRVIHLDALGPTLLSKRGGSGRDFECPGLESVLTDGHSYPAITRWNAGNSSATWRSCGARGAEKTTRLFLASNIAFSSHSFLDAGESIKIPLRFELPAGEYEFLAGYGGGVHEFRPLVSNPLNLNINAQGAIAGNPNAQAPRRIEN